MCKSATTGARGGERNTNNEDVALMIKPRKKFCTLQEILFSTGSPALYRKSCTLQEILRVVCFPVSPLRCSPVSYKRFFFLPQGLLPTGSHGVRYCVVKCVRPSPIISIRAVSAFSAVSHIFACRLRNCWRGRSQWDPVTGLRCFSDVLIV